jgi:hypothetical protein
MGVGVAAGFTVVGTAVGAAVGVVPGAAVVGTSAGAAVGAAVGVVPGAAVCDVHPQTRIPTNRIIRTTNNFFMHLFFVISVYKRIQFL